MKDITKAALAVAKTGLPVFPTNGKKPAWSNAELGVKKGEGGYKIATTDPKRVTELFEQNARATEIAVPMGEMSGLMCVDVDLQKGAHVEAWLADNVELFATCRAHSTRSGGRHYFFRHDPKLGKLPATLAPGVDLKAAGTGYVCWPGGTPGYALIRTGRTGKFPTALLNGAGKTVDRDGVARVLGASDAESDDDLVAKIINATEIYPALRMLSYRLAGRGTGAEEITGIMERIMLASDATNSGHARHEDWADRYGKISSLAESAVEKNAEPDWGGPEALADMNRIIGEGSFLKPETFDRLVEAALPRKKAKRAAPTGLREWDKKKDAAEIKPRPWLVGDRLLRGQLSVLAAPGGTGKSSMALATALAVASGGELTGEYLHAHGNAWVINNEDPYSEMDRRLIALRDYHCVKKNFGGKVFLSGAPEKAGEQSLLLASKSDTHADVELHEEVFEYIETMIVEHGIVYCSMDPLISLIQGIDSNDNDAISTVARRARLVSFKTGCALEMLAHTNKSTGAERAGNPDVIRGASTLVDTARIATTLMQMSLADAKNFLGKKASPAEIDKLRARFFRADIAKGNFSRRRGALWYEMVSHDLGQGDEMGVPVYVGDWSCLSQVMMDELGGDRPGPRWAYMLVQKYGESATPLRAVFKDMAGTPDWPWSVWSGDAANTLRDEFGDGLKVGDLYVRVAKNGPHEKSKLYLYIEKEPL